MDHEDTGCAFVLFPVGDPMRVIHQHPTVDSISDALGGAVPVPLVRSTGHLVAWVRETCSTEGQPRNDLATLAAHILGQGGKLPILGPCVITGLRWNMEPGLPTATGQPEGFAPHVIEGLQQMMTDLDRALSGYDGDFTDTRLDAEWAASVRSTAELFRHVPIPDEYPYIGVSRPPASPDDEVWSGVARSFHDGRTFVPLPLKTE
jgi:hypothetical protein